MKKYLGILLSILITYSVQADSSALNHITTGLERFLDVNLSEKVVLAGKAGMIAQRDCSISIDVENDSILIEDQTLSPLKISLKDIENEGRVIDDSHYGKGYEFAEVRAIVKTGSLRKKYVKVSVAKDVYSPETIIVDLAINESFGGFPTKVISRVCNVKR
jgi:hypothetical protein